MNLSPQSGADYKDAVIKIEAKWQAYWETHQTYSVTEDSTKPKYYVLDMFPYPSGEGLHVGHPAGYIASDIIARYKWLEGFNVLHPMGFDAFGLPAEQYAIQTGAHPQDTTTKNMAKYEHQLRKIGLAYDWSRKIATCESSYYHWTQWIFIALYNHYYNTELQQARPIAELIDHLNNHGTHQLQAATHDHHELTAQQFNQLDSSSRELILHRYRLAYLDDALVNWCDELGTVLANDEIKDGLSVRGGHPIRQTKIKHWKLRVSAYAPRLLAGLSQLDWSDALKAIQRNWLGRSRGTQISFTITTAQSPLTLTVFTSRADTIYGVSFLVMAPEHPLIDKVVAPAHQTAVTTYINQVCSQSLKERSLNKSQPTGVFSGAYAIHPLTAQKLPVWIAEYVLMDYGEGAIMAVPADDERDHIFAQHFNLPIPTNYQVGTTLEGLDQPQARNQAEQLLAECDAGQPQVNFRLRDAIFARQRYWGEPIPIYYDNNTPIAMDPADLPLKLPAMSKFTSSDGQPPLASVATWTHNGHPIDVTTMPGYAGSSAYYLRYMDPHNTKAVVSPQASTYWQNVDLYVGGAEHATGHLIYARTWNMFLYDIGISQTPEPFKKLLNQGMILGESQYIYRIKGSQTFVSYGMHHDYDTQRIPISIALVRHGILNQDALRAWRPEFATAQFICADNGFRCESITEKMSKSLYNTVTPDEIIAEYGADTLRLYEMFLGPIDQAKPWSSEKITGTYRFLCRFWRLFHPHGTFEVSQEPPTPQELTILHKTIKEVRLSTTSFHFNVAISGLMSATNELSKLRCNKHAILHPLLLLIAPYCPHLAEELNEQLGYRPSIFTHNRLPEPDPTYLDDPFYELPVSVNGKLKFKIMMDRDATADQIKQQVSSHPRFRDLSQQHSIVKWIIRPQAIVNLVTR